MKWERDGVGEGSRITPAHRAARVSWRPSAGPAPGRLGAAGPEAHVTEPLVKLIVMATRGWLLPGLLVSLLCYQVQNGTIVLAQPPTTGPAAATRAQGTGEAKLAAARQALTGSQKDAARARGLLQEIIDQDQATLQAGSLAYVYVYLGYLEDRAGARAAATGWYQKALGAPDSDPGIRQCAEYGLKQPLTWIRHLDGTSAPARPGAPKSRPPAKGYVATDQPPADLVPASTLSAPDQRKNFDFLCQAIDETYADFELKGIDWEEVQPRYRAQLQPGLSADEFYRLLFRLVNELKDAHSWLQNYHVAVPSSAPELTVDLLQGKPFVVAVSAGSEAARLGAKPGSEVLTVDGLPFEKKVEALRPLLRACSTERAFRREACRQLLTGERGTSVAIRLRAPDAREEVLTLRRTGTLTPAAPPACPFELTRQRFVQFAREPSGLGYIRVVSFEGRGEVADEFDRALEALRAAPGLILDIRNNRGGFGPQHMVGRFLTKPTLCAIGYRKNGPGHHDLRRQDDLLDPTGPWQYTCPVVLLVNDVTGSAADLFACYLRSAKRVLTVGTTTHGNLAGVAAYAVLPCGLVVRISNGYVCDAQGKPIEGTGNEPDIAVDPTVADFLAGKDPVLEKAVKVLNEKLGREQSGS